MGKWTFLHISKNILYYIGIFEAIYYSFIVLGCVKVKCIFWGFSIRVIWGRWFQFDEQEYLRNDQQDISSRSPSWHVLEREVGINVENTDERWTKTWLFSFFLGDGILPSYVMLCGDSIFHKPLQGSRHQTTIITHRIHVYHVWYFTIHSFAIKIQANVG